MAVFSLTDASVVINSVDLSDHVRSVTVEADVNELDTTAMGDTWTTMIGGVNSGSVQLDLYNDHAASNVDATMWAALGTVVPFVIKPTSSAVSATNPSYSGSLLVSGHTVGGSHGETPMVSRTYPASGTVTRATS